MKQQIAKVKELVKSGVITPSAAQAAMQALVADLDPIIRLDRTASLVYPNYVKEPFYPELEKTGSSKIDITKVELWLHPQQKNERGKGRVISSHLKDSGLLESCFGFTELLAMQARGIGFFRRRFFSCEAVLGWKGLFYHSEGYYEPYVPCLAKCGCGNGVKLSFRAVNDNFYSVTPSLIRMK